MTTIQAPSGRWIFVGSGIPGALAYEHISGRPATEQELATAKSFGPRLAHVRSVSFETREQAVKAALLHGVAIE